MTVEVTIRKGVDYMSPQKRAMYCHFQASDHLTAVAQEMVHSQEPGAARIQHVISLASYVKNQIEYEQTGLFPQGTDYTIEKASSGDCVDQSVLLISLLGALEIESRYCCYHEAGHAAGHCVVEVRVPDDPEVRDRVDNQLHDAAGLSTGTHVCWDLQGKGTWLLIDPTSPLPVGFDRHSAYEVSENGIQWDEGLDLVCFAPQ